VGEDRDTGTYSIQHPPHGMSRRGPAVGAPKPVEPEPTPLPEPPRIDGPTPHLDVEQTLVEMHRSLQMLQRHAKHQPPQSGIYGSQEVVSEIEGRIRKTQNLRYLGAWVIGLISVIFSAGVAYQMFMGANATDDEVDSAVHDATIEHNGIDPDDRDEHGRRYGAHPQMKRDIKRNADAVEAIKSDLGTMEVMQRKLDKRSEYQYWYSRWREDVEEAKTKRRRLPEKPDRLKELEHELTFGL